MLNFKEIESTYSKIEFVTKFPEDKSFLFNKETKIAIIFQYIIYFSGYYSS